MLTAGTASSEKFHELVSLTNELQLCFLTLDITFYFLLIMKPYVIKNLFHTVELDSFGNPSCVKTVIPQIQKKNLHCTHKTNTHVEG